MENGQIEIYEGDISELFAYVARHHTGKKPIEGVQETPPHFEWVHQFFKPCRQFVFNVSHMHQFTPRNPEKPFWVEGFPHVHNRGEDTVTAITYLNFCDDGCMFIEPDTPEEIMIVPGPGVTTFVDGETPHGVAAISKGDRFAIHVTGYQI